MIHNIPAKIFFEVEKKRGEFLQKILGEFRTEFAGYSAKILLEIKKSK